MDIKHIKIVFVDTFSGAKEIKHTTVSEYTFNRMKTQDIGKIIPYFDKKQQIKFNYKITEILPA